MTRVIAYRCAHSGKYFPSDYIREWGRKYGIGLGPRPVSEILNTDETMPIAVCKIDLSKSMRPMGNTFAQMDFVFIEEEEYEKNKAVLAIDDGNYDKRAEIVQAKQKKNNPRLVALLNGTIQDED